MASVTARHDREGNHIGWRAQVRRRGYPPQVRTFRRRTEAVQWARDVENRMDRGVFQDLRESERTTLAELLARYAAEVAPEKRSSAEPAALQMFQRSPLAIRPVAAITATDIAAWRDSRLGEVAPATVVRELTVLSHVFATAEREWSMSLPRGNPVALVRRPKAPRGRTRRLVGDEEERLLRVALDYESNPRSIRMASIIPFSLETALRRGEVAGMEWGEIDLSKRSLHLPETKTDVPRTVPLSPKAVEVLESIPRRIDGWVWANNMTPHAITRAFTRICSRAGIEDLHFHDLRHEAISRLFERTDLDIMEISRISGHRSLSMLSRYTHLRAHHLADRLAGKRRGEGVT